MSTGEVVAASDAGQRAFMRYESIRHRLPQAQFSAPGRHVSGLLDLAEEIDVFVLDGFGVLNVGGRAIPGVKDVIAELRRRGRRVMVLTNAAGYPRPVLMQRYQSLGYDFASQDVISSRQVMLAHAPAGLDGPVGVMASGQYGREELPRGCLFLDDDPLAYERAACFFLLGASAWSDARQAMLVRALRAQPRPVYVGNPDLVAPVEGGLSREPGEFAHALADATGILPEFHGKPFATVFEAVRARIPDTTGNERIVMVGDTLHTDILGGCAAGWKTALVTGFGVYAGWDYREAIRRSGIMADFVMERP